jgi:archaellum component FlaG (FlaF/FlaG flagellin family)
VPSAAPLRASQPDTWTLEVEIANTGSEPVAFTSGIARGTVLDHEGNVVASSANAMLTSAGIWIDLAPGESARVPVLARPYSCDARLGYVLPLGEYQLTATVSRDGAAYLVPPAAITISE